MNKLITFVVVVVTLGITSVRHVTGFRCYECNFCSDPFDPDSADNVTVTQCNGTCYKSVIKHEHVTRKCMHMAVYTLNCTETIPFGDYHVTQCHCRGDLCNHDNQLLPSIFALSAALLIPIHAV